MSSARIVDELWGENPPPSANHAIEVHVSAIRKALHERGVQEALLPRSGAGYSLAVPNELVDANEFEQLVAKGQSLLGQDPATARQVFDRALALWRGPPLAEFERFEFAARESNRLQELRSLALESSADAALALGELSWVIRTATRLVADEPLRGRPRELLMQALYRAGRQAEALEVYRDACDALDQIGLAPSPQLRALETSILRHDAALRPMTWAARESPAARRPATESLRMSPTERSASTEWLNAVVAEERRGEFLSAVDVAERGLAEHPRDVPLKHRAVLALARAGATEEAARRFERYGLDAVADEDVAALRARIAKDRALAADGADRAREATHAAELYAEVFSRTTGFYPAINAATMHLIAGDQARSRSWAAEALRALPVDGAASYYAAATEAEALLLLGEPDQARGAIERASELHGGDLAAVAATRRQLRLVCTLTGIAFDALEALSTPSVVHFCGHRIAETPAQGRFPAAAEAAVDQRIREVIADARIGFAYGALASGADILWAEALLAAGAELHVILPFDRDEFIARSVSPAGSGWVERFERCEDAATTLRFATDQVGADVDVRFRFGGELAMGLALLRARYLDTEVRQLAVWDGQRERRAVGTAFDVGRWRRRGLASTRISPDLAARVTVQEATPGEVDGAGASGERSRELLSSLGATSGVRGRELILAMLYADVRGVSAMDDDQWPAYADHVLAGFASVLSRHEAQILVANNQGGLMSLVMASAEAAAQCALELLEQMDATDLDAVGLPSDLSLRVGGHVGPVLLTQDPVGNGLAVLGSHLKLTAELEPAVPAGAVYVTDAFAAVLELDGSGCFNCDYVGHMTSSGGGGRLRMHRLRRA